MCFALARDQHIDRVSRQEMLLARDDHGVPRSEPFADFDARAVDRAQAHRDALHGSAVEPPHAGAGPGWIDHRRERNRQRISSGFEETDLHAEARGETGPAYRDSDGV